MQMPEKLPIGITFALHSESSDFIRQLRQVENGDNLLWGKIGDRDVTIVHTGVGANNCNERLEILLGSVDGCVSGDHDVVLLITHGFCLFSL